MCLSASVCLGSFAEAHKRWPAGACVAFLVEMLRTGTSRLELVLELVVKRNTTGRTGGERKENNSFFFLYSTSSRFCPIFYNQF